MALTARAREQYRRVQSVSPAALIRWDKQGEAVPNLTRALLETVGTPEAVAVPMTAYNFRLLGAVRGRLYTRGCSLRVRTSLADDCFHVWANVTNRPARLAWQREAIRW